MFTQLIVALMSLPLGLTLSAAAHAQTPVIGQMTQARLSSAESESDSINEDEKESKTGQDKKDPPSLQEEVRQMRQLLDQMRQVIERQEARISLLEAEKSASAAKPASTPGKAAPVGKDTSPAAPGRGQENPPGAAGKDTSTQAQTSKNALDQSQTAKGNSKDTSKDNSKDNSKDTSKDTSKLSTDDRDTLDFWRDTTVNVVVDGYYGYNFNRPLGGINLLRAYDVL